MSKSIITASQISGSLVGTGSFGRVHTDGTIKSDNRLEIGSNSNFLTTQLKVGDGTRDIRLNANHSSNAVVGTVGAHNFNIMTGNTFRVNIDGDNLGGMGIGMDAKGDEKLVVAGDTGITGSLHVSGNITTSGSIIAKEFRTELVNQIIATSSGSTSFGDDKDDIHRFTGSIQITASNALTTQGPITIDGDPYSIINLNGTAETFLEKDAGTTFFIANNVSDQDIKFRVLDGSSQVTAIHIDTSETGRVKLPNDNQRLTLGEGDDLQLSHESNNNYIATYSGNLILEQNTNDADIIFNCDDGSGGVTAYLTLDGSTTEIAVSKNMIFGDDVKARFGADDDLDIYWDGSNSYIENNNEHLIIVNNENDHDIYLKSDNGSGGTTNYITLDGSTAKLILQRPTFIGTHFGEADSQLHVSESFMEAHIGSGSLMTVFETKGTSSNPDFKIVDKDNNNARAALQVQGNAGAIECLFVASAGNVGVGTTSPGAKLEVIGDVSASLTSTGSFGALAVGISSPLGHLHINTETAQATIGYIDGESSQDKVLLFRHYGNSEAAGHLQYAGFIGSVVDNVLTLGHYDNSASEIQALNIAEDGDVGIGTTSPDTSLDVRASGVQGIVINQDEANADISSRLFFKEQNSTITLYNTGDTFSFRTGATIGSTSGTERATINSNGQVLATEFVGNSDANTGLRVAGSDALSLKTGGTTALSIDSSQDTTLAGNLFTTSTSNDTGSIIVLAADAEAVLTTRNDSATGDPHQFLIKHKGGGTILQNLRGDIEVSSSLHMGGGHPQIQLAANHSTDKIRLYAGGNEKIGTAANTIVYTADNHDFRDTAGHDNLQIGSGEVVVNEDSEDVDFRVESNASTHLLFCNGGTSRVGIGTGSPGSLLEVHGDISASVSATGSFGALRVESKPNGTTVETDDFGLTITGQVGYYPLTVQSPYETAARFLSTDGTANIEIGDNSSTANHNRIQVVGNVMELVAANSKRVELSSGAIVFNQDSDDVDFRVETNGNTHTIFAEGSTDRVAIGHDDPDTLFHIADNPVVMKMERAGTRAMRFGVPDNSSNFVFADSDDLKSSQRMVIDNSGLVGIGTTAPYERLYVECEDVNSPGIVSNPAATNGAIAYAIGYGDSNRDYLNTWGMSYSAGATVFGYGLKPHSGSDETFVNSADNSNFTRGALYMDNELRFYNAGAVQGTIDTTISTTQRFYLDASGDLEITGDYTSDTGIFQSDDASTDLKLRRGTNDDDIIIIEASQTRIIGDASERCAIGSFGYRNSVDGSASTPSYSFTNDTNSGMFRVSSDVVGIAAAGNSRFTVKGNGIKAPGGSLGVNTDPNSTDGMIHATNDIVAFSSDKRLKENIRPIENALDKIDKLSGFVYNWNEKANKEAGYDMNKDYVGVFAQDVEKVQPEAVELAPFDNDSDDNSISGENYLTVQYEKLVPLLIESIKELKQEIKELKKQ